jgi:RNA-directed DNA polymerase
VQAHTSSANGTEKQTNWNAINWRKANRTVRHLRQRIFRAAQEGNLNKVRSLQKLMLKSYSNRLVSVRRVTQINAGKDTPGMDKLVIKTPAARGNMVASLAHYSLWKAKPTRRVYIPKASSSKLRPLGIPCMRCRAMQALYLLALDPIAEATADRQSYGFRRERSTADAMQKCFLILSRKYSPQWVLEGDIKGCFDAISHTWLLTHIPMEKAMLQKWLKAGYMEKHVLYPTEAGTPQGGICSPVLANMTLDGLEARLREKFPERANHSHKGKVSLIRYADDVRHLTH